MSQFSVITDAPSDKVMAAFDAPLMGNRKVKPVISLAGMDEGKAAIIVTVEDWAGSLLTAALRRMGAWFDRIAPQGRIPTGRPIVSHAGASQVRREKRIDDVTRRDRAIRRAMKAA
jgi:hypothetical protein